MSINHRYGLKAILRLLPLLLLASNVSGQTSGTNCDLEDRTVETQVELDRLSTCRTLNGDLILGLDLTNITIPGLQTIRGDFIAHQGSCESISAPSLSFVGGLFYVGNAENLTTISMPSLATVGSFRLDTIPNLRTVDFSSQIDSIGDDPARSLVIWGTGLDSLAPIIYRNVQNVQINDNPDLKNITLQVQNVTGGISFRRNGGPDGAKVSLDQLEWADSLLLDGLNSISIPKLTHINNVLQITANNSFDILEFPNLTSIGSSPDPIPGRTQGYLELTFGEKLRRASFPKLQWITDYLQVRAGPVGAEPNLGAFPVLQTVGQYIDIIGNFTSIDFPKLQAQNAKSKVSIMSSDLNCTDFVSQEFFRAGNWSTPIECNGEIYNTTSTKPSSANMNRSFLGSGIRSLKLAAGLYLCFLVWLF
ncbi:hypothetical protein H072_848 [Dactylellina haptotyla CBS 200.50]|uniref:Receptor L-domain domain-containing protein n=1 Tax=Dactylellina haptotyla (strain CBS 200.50) TaxID=1284197 RepID=S8C0C0_DACHA|nr:hypothetical protein H072_848 [Dactylellina haptotyla CBS 200.50]